MIRAAIVGLGRWGRNLVEASLGHERLKIVRAVEPDIKAAQGFCAQHHLELTGSLDAVLADDAIDAVLLATPHSLHPAQVIACAVARKQVFCEKPLALTRADAARMFGACRDAGVVLAVAVGHHDQSAAHHGRRRETADRRLPAQPSGCQVEDPHRQWPSCSIEAVGLEHGLHTKPGERSNNLTSSAARWPA